MRKPPPSGSGRLQRAIRRLRGDDRGNVLVYVTLSIAALMGMAGLALDGARTMINHSEAQSAADAAALAGASQLDAQSGACARAKAEAAVTVNKDRFAQGGPVTVALSSSSPPRCLSGLPTSDAAAVGTSLVTTSDTAAKYIEVTTQQLTHANTLLNVVSAQSTATVQRKAVAGFRRTLCAASPIMMMCTSDPWTVGVAFDAWGNNGPNKGFICPGCNSANEVEAALGQSAPPFCVADKTDPAPGSKTGKAPDGINTRFGQGSTTARPSDTDIADFRSYSNDITGGAGWNCTAYWSAKHATDGLAKPAGCTATSPSLTRYAVYQLERSAGKVGQAPAAGVPTTTAERRLLYLAVIACPTTAQVSPLSYVRAFIIGPAEGASAKHVYVEPIGVATSKVDPTGLHEEVQLYR